MTDMKVFDDTQCSLGEGPLWHPEREQFFWFDINTYRLYSHDESGPRMWQFPWHVSAAGWIDRDRLMVASENALLDFNIETGKWDEICPMEADNPVTRSNDGRADPYGGFWIGTMGKQAEPDAGAIYRYYRGELRQIYAPWTIPNAMCFTPDGGHAYLTDTPNGRVLRQRLDKDGWPDGDPEVFLELHEDQHRPDGAVVDTNGNLWCAQYGHGKVSVFSPEGKETRTIDVPGKNSTCPAFGGANLHTLYVTSASQNIATPTEGDGRTFAVKVEATGQKEHRVIL